RGLAALDLRMEGCVRQGPVKRIARKVEAAQGGLQELQPHVRMDQRLEIAVLFFGLRSGAAHDYVEFRHDLHIVGGAAVFAYPPFHVDIELLRALKRQSWCENRFSDARAKLHSDFRRSRLEDHRSALRGPGDIQWSADRENS